MDDDDDRTSYSTQQEESEESEKMSEILLCFEEFRLRTGIPRSTFNSESFRSMIEAIGQYGPGLRPPTPDELRGPLLKKQVSGMTDSIEELKKSGAWEGCSIMLDAWTDDSGRRLMNLSVHCSHGVSFLRSIHLSSVSHDDAYVVQLLDLCIDEVGEKNVVHIVTNIKSDNMVAKMITAKRPHMIWTQCAAQCIDLVLEEIEDIASIKSTVAKARSLTSFIYSCGSLMDMLGKFTKEQDLVQVGITHSTTSYLNLKSLYDKRIELRTMFISKEWEDSKWSKEAVGEKFYNLALSRKFWRRVLDAINIFEPLVDVMRRMGSGILSTGYIYGDLGNAKKEISLRLEHNEEHYLPIWNIIDKRCDSMLNTPLNLAGYYLNPFFYYQNKTETENNEIFTDALDVCARSMYKDQSTQEKILNQLKLYKASAKSFGRSTAIRQRTYTDLDPGSAKELTAMALRILKLTCGSLVCERSWIEKLYKKPPARFTSRQFKNFAFVMANLRLKELARRKERDPLVPYQADDDEPYEWLDADYNGDSVSESRRDERPGHSDRKRKSPCTKHCWTKRWEVDSEEESSSEVG